MEATLSAPESALSSDVNRIFKLQQENQYNIANTSASERKAKLKKLHKAILQYRSQLKDALYQDFRKHPSEVDLTDIYPVVSEIKHTISHLNKWMKLKKVGTPLALMGSSSHIKYEPKGVVLVISPWNFPVNLTFGPLVGAIAAGNGVMLKPSENTPYTSALMKKIIDEIFNENEVALIEGGIETSTELLELPFNHIFFTGAPSIGKIVMKAAAKNLASVTLELGGKSPTIVDDSADIKLAAKRIAWGKYVNNGQICLAPDYIFVHDSKKVQFLDEIKKNLNEFYTEDASQESSYSRIVNNRHYNRIKSYVDDAVSKGAKVEIGGKFDGEQDYISPTVMTNVAKDSTLMTEEIFGPILPVYGFSNINEVISDINSREKPLGLYIYSKNNKNIDKIISNTRAGGTCVNHNAAHYYNNNLPFGGSNNSGIGKGHGWFSFEAFSNSRAVFKQHIPNALDMLVPPYNDFKQKLIDLTIKYF